MSYVASASYGDRKQENRLFLLMKSCFFLTYFLIGDPKRKRPKRKRQIYDKQYSVSLLI